MFLLGSSLGFSAPKLGTPQFRATRISQYAYVKFSSSALLGAGSASFQRYPPQRLTEDATKLLGVEFGRLASSILELTSFPEERVRRR